MNWEDRASTLADTVTHPGSRWRGPVATTPRHLFVPRWWQRGHDGWELRDCGTDEEAWLDATYADTSLVTRVGAHHADHAAFGDHPTGQPTSSATLPGLTVRMYQHALLDDNCHLLDVGTGSGYGAALAARRLDPGQVVSVDVDAYLVEAARSRLHGAGVRPTVQQVDATGPLPFGDWTFDRIVATVAVRKVPESWLTVLCTGGRLVTTLAGTSLILTAEKQADGGAVGRIEWDRAGFMQARTGEDCPPGAEKLLDEARTRDDGEVTTGPYPVVDVANAWDLSSMLELSAPGIAHAYEKDGDRRTALMAHPDGSWARATAQGDERPLVHQGGPRRLWNLLDDVRGYWLSHGELPVRGARVMIKPDGTTILARGKWHTKLT